MDGKDGRSISRRRRRFAFVFAATAMLASVESLMGATISWLTAVGGDWFDPARWSSGSVPNSATTEAMIAAGGSDYAVSFNGFATVGSLTLNSTNAALSVQSGALNATGDINVQNGSLFLLGGGLGAGGKINIGSGGTVWTGRDDFSFPAFNSSIDNSGFLRIQNAAALVKPGVTITNNAGSNFLIVNAFMYVPEEQVQSGVVTPIVNHGLMVVANVFTSGEYHFGSHMTLTNTGTLTMGGAGGSGYRFYGENLNSTGTISVSTAYLAFNSPGVNSGTLVVPSGTILSFEPASGFIANGRMTFNAGTSFSGTGVIYLNSSTVNVPWTHAGTTGVYAGVTQFNQSVSGGIMNVAGPGTTNFNSTVSSALNVSGGVANVAGPLTVSANSTLSGGALNVAGDITFSGGNGTWTGGTMGAGGNIVIGPGRTFWNGGDTYFAPDFNRSIENNGFLLRVQNVGAVVTPGVSITNAAGSNFQIVTAYLNVNNPVQGVVTPIINNGTMLLANNFSSAEYQIGHNMTLTNTGVFTSDNTSGTGWGYRFLGDYLNNSGTIQVNGTYLALDSAGVNTGTVVVPGGSNLSFTPPTGSMVFNAGTSFSGTGLIDLRSCTVNAAWTFAGTTATHGGTTQFNQPVSGGIMNVAGPGTTNFNSTISSAAERVRWRCQRRRAVDRFKPQQIERRRIERRRRHHVLRR